MLNDSTDIISKDLVPVFEKRATQIDHSQIEISGVIFRYLLIVEDTRTRVTMSVDGTDMGEVFWASQDVDFYERMNEVISVLNVAFAKINRGLGQRRNLAEEFRTPLVMPDFFTTEMWGHYVPYKILEAFYFSQLLWQEYRHDFIEETESLEEDFQTLYTHLQKIRENGVEYESATLRTMDSLEASFLRMRNIFTERMRLHTTLKGRTKPSFLTKKGL